MRRTFARVTIGWRNPAAAVTVMALLTLALLFVVGLGAQHDSLCTARAPQGCPLALLGWTPVATLVFLSLLALPRFSLPSRLALGKRFHPPRG
ncbi:MAG: hypothetical protein HYY96_04070 [Candidatus Tectomicrobia bacterium]|nr:hypothetical protein [Candidatus Tectomicrobia bacterium]